MQDAGCSTGNSEMAAGPCSNQPTGTVVKTQAGPVRLGWGRGVATGVSEASHSPEPPPNSAAPVTLAGFPLHLPLSFWLGRLID